MNAVEFDKVKPVVVEYLKSHKSDNDTFLIGPTELHKWLMNHFELGSSPASSVIWYMLDDGVIEFGTGGYEIVVE